jgi:glucosamine--fructose-6-phosphate aminotransferase (isomerizing)
MCGIFGLVSGEKSALSRKDAGTIIDGLFALSEMRGKESAGISIRSTATQKVGVYKQSLPATKLIKSSGYKQFTGQYLDPNFENQKANNAFAAIAHARLVTNGTQNDNTNNQPIIKNGAIGVHNGIVCNIDEMWQEHADLNREYEVDTEWLIGLMRQALQNGESAEATTAKAFDEIEGTASTALLFDNSNDVLLGTNCGSLYYLTNSAKTVLVFASEKMILTDLLDKGNLRAVLGEPAVVWMESGHGLVIDATTCELKPFDVKQGGNTQLTPAKPAFTVVDASPKKQSNIVMVNTMPDDHYQALMEFNVDEINDLKRCTKCILPDTFPFIEFDDAGVCSYCNSHEQLKFEGMLPLEEQLAKHRKSNGEPDCIVTLSGGRDSCYVLHNFVEEFNMTPIAYTYDWGMVTDLARRNAARMCGALGVEHIVISADINTKRSNIKKNVNAWLKRPKLGTIPLFMAGDKQYFYYANMLKKKYKIDLVVMGENMLETTNFKSGFCGIKPKFGTENTFTLTGADKLKMLWFYGKEYMLNPSYLNSSMRDTMHAFFTYYFMDKDNLNLFDYMEWDEEKVNDVLLNQYNWELSPDTTTTWRIGDGTAAFYNYIYYNVAGFSEFDTFRSNQIREGMITREEAIRLVNIENMPRYESFKWYCDTVGVDFERAVKRINAIPKFYRKNK